jgi:hypothetical protein
LRDICVNPSFDIRRVAVGPTLPQRGRAPRASRVEENRLDALETNQLVW